jgi:hypothetical protein
MLRICNDHLLLQMQASIFAPAPQDQAPGSAQAPLRPGQALNEARTWIFVGDGLINATSGV